MQFKRSFINQIKSHHFIYLFALILFFHQCSFRPRLNFTDEDTWHTIIHNKKTRRYLIHTPDPYKKNAPLLLVLHGGGGKIKSILRVTKSRFNSLANQNGFLVVYPEGLEKHWNDGRLDPLSAAHKNNHDDTGFIKSLISKLTDAYYIDQKRIFVVGISNGGMMAQRLACQLPQIRAIVSVVSQMPLDLKPNCHPTRPISVMLINGTDDPVVPYNGGDVTIKILRTKKRGRVLGTDQTILLWRQFNKCNDRITKTQIPDLSTEDGSQITRMQWNTCNGNAKVVLLRVSGGGHTWPGGWSFFSERIVGKTNKDIDAADIIWEFFQKL